MGKFAQFNDPAGQSTNLKCHTTGQFPCLDGEVTERFGLAQQNLALVLFLGRERCFCDLAGINFA